MLHLTLNTGQVIEHSLADIDQAAIEALRPLVAAGGGPLPPPCPDFQVQIRRVDGGAVFNINRHEGQLRPVA